MSSNQHKDNDEAVQKVYGRPSRCCWLIRSIRKLLLRKERMNIDEQSFVEQCPMKVSQWFIDDDTWHSGCR